MCFFPSASVHTTSWLLSPHKSSFHLYPHNLLLFSSLPPFPTQLTPFSNQLPLTEFRICFCLVIVHLFCCCLSHTWLEPYHGIFSLFISSSSCYLCFFISSILDKCLSFTAWHLIPSWDLSFPSFSLYFSNRGNHFITISIPDEWKSLNFSNGFIQ